MATKRATLYWDKICPFVHRAWIAAIEKQAPIDLCHIPLNSQPEWYVKEINSRETVPALKTEEGKIVLESLYITQYFDEHYGEKFALQPGTPLSKYRMRVFVQAVDDAIGNFYELIFNKDESVFEEKKKELFDTFAGIEKKLSEESDGPFFFGQTFSMADIALVPFLDRFQPILLALLNINFLERFPRLRKLYDAASLRPSLTQTMQPASFYISFYGPYCGREPTYQPKLTLYTMSKCPFCDRVRATLALKGVDYQEVEVPLPAPQWYTDNINSNGSVPTLEVAPGNFLTESLLIVQYIVDAYPLVGPVLMPTDPQLRADIRFFVDELGEAGKAMYGAIYGEGEQKEAAKKQSILNLGHLNGYFKKQSAGPWFLGAEPSYADVVALPFLVRNEPRYESFGGTTPFAEAHPQLAKFLTTVRKDERLSKVVKSNPEDYLK